MLAVAAGLAGDHERGTARQREMLAIVEPRGEGIKRSSALWAGGLLGPPVAFSEKTTPGIMIADVLPAV